MKNILFLTTLVFCCFVNSFTAKASHVMGTDIRWECLGSDSFKITVTVYRDCNGVDLSSTGIYAVSQCTGQSINVGGTRGTGKDITPVCESACNRCENPGCTDTKFGIQQIEVTGYVKLDRTKCCEWKITWGQCCRNGAITTGAANENFFSEAFMDICVSQCNNSPYFTLPPLSVFCKDRCVIYNPAVHDKDIYKGEPDSLVYKLGQPLSAAGTTIPYYPGFSYDEPLSYHGDPDPATSWEPNCGGFHLNSATGELRFKPTKVEQTVLVIAVEEWRKDLNGTPQKIGEVRRDMQIGITDDCNANSPPSLVSFKNTYTFCVDQPNCIYISTSDADGDSVSLSWNDQIPEGSFTSETGKKFPKASFCWTPDSADIRSYPYQFVVEGRDNTCTYPGITHSTFSVYVKPSPAATYTFTSDSCGNVQFSAEEVGDVVPIAMIWTGETPYGDEPLWYNGADLNYLYSEGGTYNFTLTLITEDSCKAIYMDSVVIPQKVKVDLPKDTVLCINTTIDIPSKAYLGKPPYSYKWFAGADSIVGDSTTTKLQNIYLDKDTSFTVYVTDAKGCVSWDTMHIKVVPPSIPELGDDLIACNKNITIDASEHLKDTGLTYEWLANTNGSFYKAGQDSVLTIKDSGTYVAMITNFAGCIVSDTIRLTQPLAEFTFDTAGVLTYSFKVLDTTGISTYKWYFGDSYSLTQPEPTYTYAKDGVYKVTLEVTALAGCKNSFSLVIVARSCKGNKKPNIATIDGKTFYNVCAGDSICIDFAGSDPDGDSISLNFQSTVKNATFKDSGGFGSLCWLPDKTMVTGTPQDFYVTISDHFSNCPATDSQKIQVMVHGEPNAAFTYDSLTTRNFKFIPADTTGASYLWHFGDGDSSTLISPEHTWARDSTYTVTLTVTSQAGCTATSSQTYTIDHTVTSILSKDKNTSWKVYPNPIKDDRLIIEAGAPSNGPYDLMLYDISGRKVAEKLNVNDRKTVLELPEDLKPGNYLLHIQAGEVYTTEIVVK